MMRLEKLLSENPLITSAVGTTIAEYDIAAAAPTAIRYICGVEVYNNLMKMDKAERNRQTGLMQRDDSTLWPKIEKITLEWFNMFLETNHIENHNFIETTRDSLLVVGKIPTQLSFDKGLINFVNKDGSYTSYFRIDGRKILFDSMNNIIRIKGVSDEYVQKSAFINKIIKPMISVLENDINAGSPAILKTLSKYRKKYIESSDLEIYRDLNSRNLFKFLQAENEIVEAEMITELDKLIKSDNYVNYIMPIIKALLK